VIVMVIAPSFSPPNLAGRWCESLQPGPGPGTSPPSPVPTEDQAAAEHAHQASTSIVVEVTGKG
jgi:hypothetical protein